MTDDLKERLLELCNGHLNATIPWPHLVIRDALASITDLEARLAAAEAGEDALAELVGQAQSIFDNCEVTDGCCCCGDSMDNHADPMSCGHVATDHGGYIVGRWNEESTAALAAYEARRG